MSIANKKILITGGTRGLGVGIVEALVARDCAVTVVARNEFQLAQLRERLGVNTVCADITVPGTAAKILSDVKPDVVILNAGAAPKMASIEDITWEDFSHTWEQDVKAGLDWVQALLKSDDKRRRRVLVTSSGAAINGSPGSGGYAGSKRMLWLMAQYANGAAVKKQLDLQFQVIVPRQMVLGTGVGDAGANAYAKAAAISPEEYVQRFGKAMSPREYGDMVSDILTSENYKQEFAFAINGQNGIQVLQSAA